MKALTVYQPWASLIIAGAKPYEFRKWDYRTRVPQLVGQRIAIHASARPMRSEEMNDLMDRIEAGESALDAAKAEPVLSFVARCALEGGKKAAKCLPLSAVLGTAIIGEPVRALELFKDKVADSDRLDQHLFAWPLTDIKPFVPPVDYRGAQGFWNFPEALAA